MAASAYFKGKDEALFVDGVDVNRAAKFLLREISSPNFKPPSDVGQAMDWLLKAVGFESHHVARTRAKRASFQTPTLKNEQPYLLAMRLSVIKPEHMPKAIGETLGSAWPEESRKLFDLALVRRDPGKVQAVAIVGGPGTGKTVLGKDAVKKSGGVIADVSLHPSMPDTSRLVAGNLVILDRPAQVLGDRVGYAGSAEELVRLMGDTTPEGQAAYRRQVVENAIKRNAAVDYEPWGVHAGALKHVQDPTMADIPLVFVVPNVESVKSILRGVVRVSPQDHAKNGYIWDSIQVVDLDAMKVYEVQAGSPGDLDQTAPNAPPGR